MKKIMSVAILFVSGCSSASEPVTTIPFDRQTPTVGEVAGTVEGDRYISHVCGIAYKLNGDFTVDWPDTDKRSIALGDYTDKTINGPVIVWKSTDSLSLNFILDNGLKEEDLNDQMREQMNSQSKYKVKSSEFVDYKIGDRSFRALKSVLVNKYNQEVSTLQIYVFNDNGIVTLITIAGENYGNVDKIARSLQFA